MCALTSSYTGHMLGLIGARNGRLVVLRLMKNAGQASLECRCDCGAIHAVTRSNFPRTKSCGCHRRDHARQVATSNRKHGLCGSPEYQAWRDMLNRCYRKKDKRYGRYGGRGIKVCKRWRDSFATFYADVGQRPGAEYSLGRIDNDGHYNPKNVEWQTRLTQANNTGKTNWITFNGETLSFMDWVRKTGINRGTLLGRLLKGWPVERALTQEVRV